MNLQLEEERLSVEVDMPPQNDVAEEQPHTLDNKVCEVQRQPLLLWLLCHPNVLSWGVMELLQQQWGQQPRRTVHNNGYTS